MKPAATYVARPIAVRAIQLPPEGEDPTDDYITSLHELLAEFDWESGRDGSISIHVPFEVAIANPGEWIVVHNKIVTIMTDESFQRNYQEQSDTAHLTTP